MIKVDVISGFLGAGKTTLIKKLFEKSFENEKVVLIENEFGEIGIDGTFLKSSGVEIKEINSGCICCSLVGDFKSSIMQLINDYSPTRIIIEPSGVGKLSDIVNAVINVPVELSLNIIATVVDGPKAKMYMRNFGEFFNNQVEAANTIVIAKTDKMNEDGINEVIALLKEKNSEATIISTNISELDSEKILNVLEQKVSLKQELIEEMKRIHDEEDEDEEHEHHHHHHHDEDEEHEHHHHDEDEDEEHENHRHHHDEDEEHHHHHHDEDEDEEHEHHHHHDEDEDEEHEHHHHHHEEDEDEEHEHHHHHHDEDEDEEHEHHHHHHHHDADEVFQSWGLETAKSISHDGLVHFLESLTNEKEFGVILRSKGILKANDNDKWYYFDYVSGDYEIRLGEPDYSGRIVVIGSEVNEKNIKEAFKKEQ